MDDVADRTLFRAVSIALLLAWPGVSHAQDAGERPTADESDFLGLHVAEDLAVVGGTEVCSPASQATQGFVCFEHDTELQYLGEPLPGVSDKVATGLLPATTRFLLSYDRALTTNFTLGVRAGYAIGGGPVPRGGASFLPIHAEVRGSYWVGANALAKTGFRPYLHVGAGMAQVDAKIEVTLVDCSTAADGSPLPAGHPDEVDCRTGTRSPPDVGFQKKLDAYVKIGRGFATAGGGFVYAFDEHVGVELNLNLMVFPSSGFVIEPSFGVLYAL